MTRSRGILILIWIGGIIAIPAIILLINTIQQHKKLESFRAELAAKGEKLRMAELAPTPHSGGAAAGEKLIDASDKLHQRVKAMGARPARLLFLDASGKSEIAYLRPTAWAGGREKSWEDFRTEIAQIQPLLSDIREASQPAELHLEPDYAKEYSVSLDFVVPPLSASQYLASENLILLRDGNYSTAVANIEAMLRLSAMLAEEPVMISQLVAFAIVGMAHDSTWNLLQADVSRPDLQGLLATWEGLRLSDNIVETLRMERAWFEAVMNAKNPPPDASGLDQPHPAIEFVWKLWLRQKDERLTLSDYQQAIEAFANKKNWSEFLANFDRLRAGAASAGIVRLLGSKALSTNFTSTGKCPSAESLQRLACTAIAIRLYAMDHEGTPPDSLQALVPEYLKDVPIDPMDAQPLRYKREGSQFLLYAVGPNGLDESGDAHVSQLTKRTILQLPDIVWPQSTITGMDSNKPRE